MEDGEVKPYEYDLYLAADGEPYCTRPIKVWYYFSV